MTTGLTVDSVTVAYGSIVALDSVSLHLPPGTTVGLVGESGSGKSTLARAIVRLVEPVHGRILLDNEDTVGADAGAMRRLRRRLQMVFQDPSASLNPRMRVSESIAEAIVTHRKINPGEIEYFLDLVHLTPELSSRFPYELSGGQRQRVAIARALAVKPDILILDEVTSALDVSAQATVLNLLRELQASLHLSYLFVTHNLDVVRYMSDRIAVMYLGRIIEEAENEAFFADTRHPYSRALLASVPRLGQPVEELQITGDPPDAGNPPGGCRFHTRCSVGPFFDPGRAVCKQVDPQSRLRDPAFRAACHFADVTVLP